MMKILRNVKFYFVIISLSMIWLVVEHLNMKSTINLQDKKIDELTMRCDSLNQEIFVLNINIGAYEVMWEMLEEKNPKLANEINNQVE